MKTELMTITYVPEESLLAVDKKYRRQPIYRRKTGKIELEILSRICRVSAFILHILQFLNAIVYYERGIQIDKQNV